jgi:hypothetical protein
LLAHALGVEPALFESVSHSGGTDVRDARAMNALL